MTVAVALLILGGGAAAARAVTGLLVAVAIVAAVVLAAAVAVLALWFRVQRRRDAEATAAYTARAQAMEEVRSRRAVERHRQAMEIAAASAPQLHITNTIDPAAIAAALGVHPQPQPIRVIRGEVER